MSTVDEPVGSLEAQTTVAPTHVSIDRALSRRVLVYGSLPPHGRDLDLLARAPERRAIEARLAAAGFSTREDEWARFADCSVEAVELANPASWELPEEELETLFAQGRPLEGCEQLVRPAPHHSLLILARRLAATPHGALDEKRHVRLEQACAEDAHAWELAREHAHAWQAQAALSALEHAYRHGTVRADLQSAAREERRRRQINSTSAPRRWLRTARELARRSPARGRVVTLSGLDGAGKSSQAADLRDILERLGLDAIVVRTRISWEDWLWRLVPAVKRAIALPAKAATMLRSLVRRRPSPHGEARTRREGDDPAHGEDPVRSPNSAQGHDPVRTLRESSNLLTDAWTVAIALANAWSQWRLMYRQLARGGVVICDRYTLDSIVAMRYAYGSGRSFGPLRAALAVLYPRPVRAYFLDVSPATALARKGEWGEEWLTRHRELYLQECPRMGVAVLDGERSREELSAQIAREVWLSGI
jgi:thymidylate kinase